MGLEDLPTFTPFLSPSFVGKYTSTMEHFWDCKIREKSPFS
jgi:hypothetical protein